MMPDVYDNKSEKEKVAYEVLYPEPDELPVKASILTTVRGKPPTITALYRARVIFDLLDMMDGKKDPEVWHNLDASSYYEIHAMALNGRHAERGVEIAQSGPKPEIPLSWLDRMMGKQK